MKHLRVDSNAKLQHKEICRLAMTEGKLRSPHHGSQQVTLGNSVRTYGRGTFSHTDSQMIIMCSLR